MNVEERVAELERKVQRLENMLTPSPLATPLKTTVYIAIAVGGGYIVVDVLYTLFCRG